MEVTGSKVTLNNQAALIAREVTVNGTTLKLRDDQGLPVWRGMGPGSGGGQGRGPAVMASVRPAAKAAPDRHRHLFPWRALYIEPLMLMVYLATAMPRLKPPPFAPPHFWVCFPIRNWRRWPGK